jgi:hypothetical protein
MISCGLAEQSDRHRLKSMRNWEFVEFSTNRSETIIDRTNAQVCKRLACVAHWSSTGHVKAAYGAAARVIKGKIVSRFNQTRKNFQLHCNFRKNYVAAVPIPSLRVDSVQFALNGTRGAGMGDIGPWPGDISYRSI